VLEQKRDSDGRDNRRQEIQSLEHFSPTWHVGEQVGHEESDPELEEQADRKVAEGIGERVAEDIIPGKHSNVVLGANEMKVRDAIPREQA
jgi:hypothetical protein